MGYDYFETRLYMSYNFSRIDKIISFGGCNHLYHFQTFENAIIIIHRIIRLLRYAGYDEHPLWKTYYQEGRVVRASFSADRYIKTWSNLGWGNKRDGEPMENSDFVGVYIGILRDHQSVLISREDRDTIHEPDGGCEVENVFEVLKKVESILKIQKWWRYFMGIVKIRRNYPGREHFSEDPEEMKDLVHGTYWKNRVLL